MFAVLMHRGYSRRFLRKIRTEVAVSFKNNNEYRREGESLPLIPVVETFSYNLGKFNATLKANFKPTQEHVSHSQDSEQSQHIEGTRV